VAFLLIVALLQLMVLALSAALRAKSTVRVIQQHCSQTCNTDLGGLEGPNPVRRGCPREFFFDEFLSIFGKISWPRNAISKKLAPA